MTANGRPALELINTLLTLEEAAAARRCSVRTLHRDIQAGRLPVVRHGRRVFVRRDVALRSDESEGPAAA